MVTATEPSSTRENDGDGFESDVPATHTQLTAETGARRWGPGRFHDGLRSGLNSGQVIRVGWDRYAAGRSDADARE